MSEFEIKIQRVRDLLRAKSVDGLWLRRADNFAWATCGASSVVNMAADQGAGSLLITASKQYVLADAIEAPRLDGEEGLAAQGWEFRISPWYAPAKTAEALVGKGKLALDGPDGGGPDLSADLVPLRANLTIEEQERLRKVGVLCAGTMDAAIRAARPGMTEHQLAALLGGEALGRGLQPIVNLIATDERVFKFRHPLPTDKPLERYAMLVLCGRKWGLVCSLTRLVHFGPLPAEIRGKADAVAAVDARFIALTRPGKRLGELFKEGIEGYRLAGFPDEWKLHHQGGLAGYAPREIVATPETDFVVQAGQAYAWNPSITGTKSEDTILVGIGGSEVITAIKGWPGTTVEEGGASVERPSILIQD